MSIAEEARERYGIAYDMPIDIELKMGDNWLDTEVVSS